MNSASKVLGLKVAGFAAAALVAQAFMEMFLGGTIPYVLPAILCAGAVYIAFFDRTPVREGPFFKRGVALLFVTFAVWLGVPQSEGGAIPWQPCSPDLIEAARKGNKPVMIDFRASWCGPCKLMERNVFSRRKVAAAAANFLALQADLTSPDKETEKLAADFQVDSIPTVIFLGTNGVERRNLRLVGYERAEDFLQRLQTAR